MIESVFMKSEALGMTGLILSRPFDEERGIGLSRSIDCGSEGTELREDDLDVVETAESSVSGINVSRNLVGLGLGLGDCIKDGLFDSCPCRAINCGIGAAF